MHVHRENAYRRTIVHETLEHGNLLANVGELVQVGGNLANVDGLDIGVRCLAALFRHRLDIGQLKTKIAVFQWRSSYEISRSNLARQLSFFLKFIDQSRGMPIHLLLEDAQQQHQVPGAIALADHRLLLIDRQCQRLKQPGDNQRKRGPYCREM